MMRRVAASRLLGLLPGTVVAVWEGKARVKTLPGFSQNRDLNRPGESGDSVV